VTTPGRHARPPARRLARTDDPVLTSKLTPPQIPDWVVPRERIESRIAEGVRGPLTVVTGPPGAGKTIAVASWAAAGSELGPTAWVTLDEYDNRQQAFWSYILVGLQSAGVLVPRAAWASVRGGDFDLGFILRLASAIVARHRPVLLILDDLHLVTDARCLNGLARLLRNARPLLRLVIASRSDPLLPLHRYRLAGELTEIRANELAFSVPEAAMLMTHHGIALPDESLEFLAQRAEGWVAALRLAAISMQDEPHPEQFVKELVAEDSPVASYLVEEVLNAEPPETRSLLLKTSVLDRVSAGIAGELAGADDAGNAFAALAQRNALVQPLHQGWYRYHPLLAEVLRLKLQREAPGQVPELRRRAARWLRRNGTLAEAVRQAAQAPDWQLAARMVVDELAIGRLLEVQGSEPLADVLRRMPDRPDWADPHPWLVRAALLLAGGADAAASDSLAAADRLLQPLRPDAEMPSRLAAAMIRLGLSRRTGELHAGRAAAAEAMAQLDNLPADLLAAHAALRPQVMLSIGLAEFWSGEFDQAAGTCGAAAAASRHASQRADCLGNLALVEALRGRLGRASELAADARGAAGHDQAHGGDSGSRAAMVAGAYVHLERGELHGARRQLKNADAELRACPDKLITAVACLVAARGCLAEGHPAAAADIAERALHGWSPAPWLRCALALVQSHALAVTGDIASALAVARRAAAWSALAAATAQARAWLAADGTSAARDVLSAGFAADQAAPDRVRLEALLLDGRISHLLGDRVRAGRALERALRLAEAEQVRLPFALERAWLAGTLREANLAHAYQDLLEPASPGRDPIRHRLVAARQAATISAGSTAPRELPVVVENLSQREREVLQHVSELLNTTEIAAAMYVSGNTVKSHLKSAFRKLGVGSRNEAVRRARELEMI
jgi:LuxR family transcriptional regulator, maltose regulon positive regulatory protein